MTTSPEIERKVAQLDNDVQSIYEMLSAIQATQGRHTNRFMEMGQKFDQFDGRLSSLEGKLDSLDGKVDQILELLRAR